MPPTDKVREFKPNAEHKINSFGGAIRHIMARHVDLVVQTEVLDDERNYQLTSAIESTHTRFKLIPSNSSLFGVKTVTDLFFGIPSLDVHITPLVGYSTVIKRLFDIIVSVILIIITAIPMLIIAILVKLSDFRGPVFFKHERVTRFGKPFYVFKFRSMYWRYCSGKN